MIEGGGIGVKEEEGGRKERGHGVGQEQMFPKCFLSLMVFQCMSISYYYSHPQKENMETQKV